MPREKYTNSPSLKEGEQDQDKTKRPVKKKHIWPEVIEPPDTQPDVPYQPEPDFEPPWF